MVIYLIFQSSPSAPPLFSAWNTGRKWYVKGVSLFKRNRFLQTPWFIGAISCIKPVLLNNRLMKINNFWLFSKKILSIIRWFAINLIILQRKEFLLKRESSFCSTFEDKNNRHTKENRNFMTIASVKELRYFYAVAWCFAIYRELMIRLFALSTTEVSNEER